MSELGFPPVSAARATLVIARSAGDVASGERAFVESSRPGAAWATYSDVLGPQDCAAIDMEAYRRARTWYRGTDTQADPTKRRGASLGRAYELRATGMLVALLRARTVLMRLAASTTKTTLTLRGAGEEWAVAGRSLGLGIADGSRVGRSLLSMTPDSGLRRPGGLRRILAAAAALDPRGSRELILSESPGWMSSYHGALLGRWSAVSVNPSPRLILAELARRRGIHSLWLVDASPDDRIRNEVQVAEPVDAVGAAVHSAFTTELADLAGWAALGASLPGRVAVAAQDVSPAIRAMLLGTRAAGGRVITVEHGIAGGYAEQVHTVADYLGTWGPIQSDYHRKAGPTSTEIVELGWPRLEGAASRPAPEADPAFDVLFFGQPATPLSAGSWPEDAIGGHAVLETYAEQHAARRVAVKPHPATRFYQSPDVAHARARIVSGDSLSLIRESRVVAAATSTTAIEAMALGRPVIQLVNRGYMGPVDFLRDSGAVLSVRDGDEFAEASEHLLSSPAAYRHAVELGREYASAFILGLEQPGSAEDRLTSLIARVLDE